MLKNNYQLELRPPGLLLSGTVLPTLKYQIDSSQIFMFSAVTWNRHKIHYDQRQAKKEGHQDVLIQRGFLGNLFCRFVNSLFVDVFVEQMDWKVINSAIAKDTLSCNGEIKKIVAQNNNAKLVTLFLTLHNEARIKIADATVVIRDIKKFDLIYPLNQF